jgi:hypothetical protein
MGDESPFAFDVILRLLGVDLGIGYRGLQLLPAADTTIWAYVGGGYEWMNYYRDSSGALIAPGALASGPLVGMDPTFVRIEGAWRLGIAQGFAWNERTKTNRVESFLFYRGRINSNQQLPNELLSVANIPDRDGIFLNVLQAGFAYDDLVYDLRHKIKDGFSAEVSAEWGPSFFFNTLLGDSDFLRFNGTLRWFVPIYDIAPDRPTNLISFYFGEFLQVDYAMPLSDAPVPLYVRQTFGGRSQNTGLGSSVRGVDTGSLDTNLKAVNSVELRMNLPALWLRDLVPGLVAFWDIGYYDQMGETGVAAPAPAGVVTSTGLGVSIDLLDLGTVAAYVAYRLNGMNANASAWSFPIEFGLHF